MLIGLPDFLYFKIFTFQYCQSHLLLSKNGIHQLLPYISSNTNPRQLISLAYCCQAHKNKICQIVLQNMTNRTKYAKFFS